MLNTIHWAPYPEVIEAIKTCFSALRKVSSPITLVTVYGIVVATILCMQPDIFEKIASDGSSFHCSDSYLWKWLHETMLWSECWATHAAQKLPDNWEDQCERAFLCMAYTIKEEDIPSELIVNTDQTQVIYAQGSNLTWAETGAKQVITVGSDEKWAFMAVLSISNSGEMLPVQAVYDGSTSWSLPRKDVLHYQDAIKHGFKFEFVNSGTYWLMQQTMHDFIDSILAPYYDQQKERLALPESQKSLWHINMWSVHWSKELWGWMDKNHSNIKIHYMPGGCTGVMQALDVGINHIYKHSLKWSYHKDVVKEILEQINTGNELISVTKQKGTMQDWSVAWMWNAFNTLNKEETVKKVMH